jgi:osmotically-inducible protein OsmY
MIRIRMRFTLPVALLASCVCCGCASQAVCGTPACQEDAAITAEVRSLLNAHPALGPNSLDVKTRNHVVYLYGLVDTEMELRLAAQVAQGAKGATQVVNLLGLNNGGW